MYNYSGGLDGVINLGVNVALSSFIFLVITLLFFGVPGVLYLTGPLSWYLPFATPSVMGFPGGPLIFSPFALAWLYFLMGFNPLSPYHLWIMRHVKPIIYTGVFAVVCVLIWFHEIDKYEVPYNLYATGQYAELHQRMEKYKRDSHSAQSEILREKRNWKLAYSHCRNVELGMTNPRTVERNWGYHCDDLPRGAEKPDFPFPKVSF